jgi:hypothetical protein
VHTVTFSLLRDPFFVLGGALFALSLLKVVTDRGGGSLPVLLLVMTIFVMIKSSLSRGLAIQYRLNKMSMQDEE